MAIQATKARIDAAFRKVSAAYRAIESYRQKQSYKPGAKDPTKELQRLERKYKAANDAWKKLRDEWAYRENPSSDEKEARGAKRFSEAFHGRGEQEIIDIVEEIETHSHLGTAGVLLKIELRAGQDIEFDTDDPNNLTYLCFSPKLHKLADGTKAWTQAYIVGGDQRIDLREFDVDPTKELITLGTIGRVFYSTDKQHLGRADKISGPYKHKLGEESGRMPDLIYDRINRLLSCAGGAYFVPVDMDGASSGIHD